MSSVNINAQHGMMLANGVECVRILVRELRRQFCLYTFIRRRRLTNIGVFVVYIVVLFFFFFFVYIRNFIQVFKEMLKTLFTVS